MKTFAAYWGLLFGLGLAIGAMSPYLGPWAAQQLGASSLSIGVMYACSAVGTMVGGPLVGLLTDRSGSRKSAIVCSMVVGGVSTLWLSRSRTVAVALVGMLGASAGGIAMPLLLVDAVNLATLGTGTTQKRSGSGPMSFVRMGFSLGFATGAPLGGVVAGAVGYVDLITVTGLLLLALAGLAWWLVPASSAPAARRERTPASLVSMAPLLLLCLSGMLVMLSDQAKSQFLPLRLTQQVHLPPSTIGLIFGVQAVLELASMPLSGWLADAIGLGPVLVATFALPVPYLLAVSVATSTPALLALQIIQATAVAGFESLAFVQAQRLAPGREGFATSLYGSGFSASQLVAGLLVGATAQQAGIAGALRLSAVPVMLGCLLLVAVLRWAARHDAVAVPQPAT